MKMLIFSVYDEKAQSYASPVFLAHKGLAIREFSDVCRDKNSSIYKHASDYKVYCLGEFDNVSGIIKSNVVPEFICSAVEFLDLDEKGVKNG